MSSGSASVKKGNEKLRMKIVGKVFKLGDHLNTDLIYPGRFLNVTDPEEMAKHALQGVREDFPSRLEKDCFILAGTNFGCGSSREQAVTCLKHAGVAAVIAKGFARIFYRNAINQGFPIIQCPEAVDLISDAQIIAVNFVEGKIFTDEKEFDFPPPPPFIMEIFKAGGLINYTKKALKESA